MPSRKEALPEAKLERQTFPPFLEGLRQRAHWLPLRSAFLGYLRTWFLQAGFLEIQTPCLLPFFSLESNLVPMQLNFETEKKESYRAFLRCSPEFSLKKILALAASSALIEGDRLAVFSNIYELGPCFRSREPLHTPEHMNEFYMLEWYRLHASLEHIIDDLEALITFLQAQLRGLAQKTHTLKTAKAAAEPQQFSWQRIRYATLMKQYAQIDFEELSSWQQLKTMVLRKKKLPQSDTKLSTEDMLNKLFLVYVEEHLKNKDAIVIYDYPAPLAANSLVQMKNSRRRNHEEARNLAFAKRFELYIKGVEVANAFEELCDAKEQKQRFLENLKILKKTSGEDFQIDEDFLLAIDKISSAAGIALGMDRLCMLLLGAKNIQDITAFSTQAFFAAP